MDNPFCLKGKKILVTGASSGIGRQIAISVSGMGAETFITGRNEQRLSDVFNLLEVPGTQYVADLDIEQEQDNLIELMPNLDGVVLSAGIVKTLPFKFINRKDLDSIFETNFFSPAILINKLLKTKKLNKNGSVVFISSIAGNNVGTAGNAMYSASKGAINAMQKVLAIELSAQRIRVNNISPGMIKTELIYDPIFTEEQLKDDEKKYPLGFGEPIDVANAAIYLLSDASKWVTGSTLIIDGGFTIQ
ncbi:SDR family oxidoreductase [Mucilaginibacter rubeus]|uniref:SDR family oxidoreductase n=1 Tax=Mucilaginibacter rubeus TaxID=2027860 RepID=A0AAE6JI21_9SPHI|nr:MULTISPECIES: SDR family oxidoreductase [Mucilaginibacter]QEM05788.1 SDR family oxidoreductase [Mucilaginibacter rubeus]QEM18371.1 SDR family oxidoreductase [Mucilaginibacter gossypii]QTE45093.1 SDR family oxidoreductase [Mucilaginibacter rubeus]QTE51690.1 SDR family oxidoreductase [Mucilaginibacter rubeus]QTE56776.1 SDR family oxidoreductase [Mucilaginibacter rubeus]